MADSMAEKCKKLTTSIFFSYPKLFTSKVLNEAEVLRSPTSILDSKPFLYGFKNPFWSETNSPETTVGEHKHYRNNLDSKGLVDALVDINDDNKHGGEITSKSQSRMILFGSQLKIQIPPSQSQSPTKSAAELGINIRNNSQLEKSAFESANSALEIIGTSKSPDRAFSATEMVLREEYTRVISHRPNPRTTHIFDIESSCFHVGCSSSATENVFLPHHHISYPFLSFCFYCKKNLGHGIDIYMYRGERAFCSNECRYQGMLLEEGMGELEARDAYGNGT